MSNFNWNSCNKRHKKEEYCFGCLKYQNKICEYKGCNDVKIKSIYTYCLSHYKEVNNNNNNNAPHDKCVNNRCYNSKDY